MKLRVNPWFTDSCTQFLNNFFKWYPALTASSLSVLEWGGGNSTLFFLQKKAKVLTIESDDAFIEKICRISTALGYKASVTNKFDLSAESFFSNDLSIVKVKDYDEIGDDVFNLTNWSMIVNDGISRKQVMSKIASLASQSIIVLDNVEYCANWGHLARSSAKPEQVRVYRKILRDENWRHYIFEQCEGRQGHSTADASGWEAPHRWASAVLWRKEHLLSKLMVSNLGFPIVNISGENDYDIKTLGERCPYDWEKMKWLKEEYPPELDLGLTRNFD